MSTPIVFFAEAEANEILKLSLVCFILILIFFDFFVAFVSFCIDEINKKDTDYV